MKNFLIHKVLPISTTLIILFSSFIITASANETRPDDEYADQYKKVTISGTTAEWFTKGGVKIGGTNVHIVQGENAASFYVRDQLNAYRGQVVQLRVYFDVPQSFVGQVRNYYIEGLGSGDYYSYELPNNTCCWFSYNGQRNQQYFEQNGLGSLGLYTTDFQGIEINNTRCMLVFFLTPNQHWSGDLYFYVTIKSFYARKNPSAPGYNRPDDSQIKSAEQSQKNLTDSTASAAASGNREVNDSVLGSIQRLGSSFGAVTAMYRSFIGKAFDFEVLLYFSLALGIIPLLVGLGINGMRGADRRRQRTHSEGKRGK